ncbi:hypothetical protein ABB37_07801 [Leptomonas pyrrhocoris]|uniref:PSP1 C-terminal domain-containing protein n=1 Tax=Leptomonas pyrrhocoris TaxID=157538 RepID=A0A0M9FV38_LEPPY|nr:hypothetical protein ABB37_07801 [Leptomonas pyrrhocoris]KPA76496.1 hypothetical protein ABB37_07801 [Leptomonas pyrrhocoris]|eukprot:XP_015654935.1 hypothetical protein ABB37_07801 [Leptomonas pyrrhocoris]
MSSKANKANGGSADGSTYHTQRYVSGRRPSARRGEAAKGSNTDGQSSAVAGAVAGTTTNTNVTAGTRPVRSTHGARTAAGLQLADEEKLRRHDTAASTSSRALSAFSPAFVPKQYQQGGEVSNALSFSSATSPLAYIGSTGVVSSVSSPLMLAVSMANPRPTITSPPTPPISEQTSSVLLPHASGNSGVVASSAAMQLREAYARAAAAKAASNCDSQSASLTSQLMQPSSVPLQNATGMLSFSATEGGASSSVLTPQLVPHQPAPPPPQQQRASQPPAPLQRSSTRETATNTPAAAGNAIYGPSVSVFHPQFIDITTGATSMTPFALLDDYVDELAEEEVEEEGAETGIQGEVAAMAQEIIDAVPLPPQQFSHQQQQRLQVAPPPRRMCATMVAVLASHDAPTAQLSLPAASRWSERTQSLQQASMHTAAPVTMQEVPERSREEEEERGPVVAIARPTPSPLHRTVNVLATNTTAAATATSTAVSAAPANTAAYRMVEEMYSQETPQRRPHRAAPITTTTTTNPAVHTAAVDGKINGGTGLRVLTAAADSAANTVERRYACLANTDERTEGGRSTASKMGLTGSVHRGAHQRYGDGDDHRAGVGGDDEDERSVESDAVTPTSTPAKVLAVEGSPFVAAAATESTTTAPPRPNRRLLTEEDNAIIFSESSLSESTRSSRAQQQPQHGATSNTNLQCAMMALMAQIQTNNSKAATSATAPTTAAAATTKMVKMTTPLKSSANPHAKNESTPASFKTPEIERVPSARPSASKKSMCRTVTTIIHSPNATTTTTATVAATAADSRSTTTNSHHHHSTRAVDATTHDEEVPSAPQAKSAQRSLASCLEAIAPSKTTTMTTRQSHDAAAEGAASQPPSSASSSFAAAVHANPNAMPVPRSQRRGGRQTGTTNSSTPVNNSSMVSNAAGPHGATHVATGPLLTNPSAPTQPTQYAVVIDGHMGRRVTAVSPTPLKAGVCVLFEEDRGIDMGRVVQCDRLEDSNAVGALPALASATSPLSRKDRPAPVLRPATAEEEYRWLYADVKEAETTLEPCRDAAARLGLPVKVVGAVYQFNKTKLTFYYESGTRVDFRPLLPSLFSRFHCRIWMSRVETPTAEGTAVDGPAFAAEASV